MKWKPLKHQLIVQASIINQIDDKYLKWVLICNFCKRLILFIRGQELITCSQILNRTLTMYSDKTLNYDCSKLSHMNVQANPTKNINNVNS